MSLLINDMDMPKGCMECICLEAFDDEIYGRQFFCGLLGIDAMAKEHSRHKKCSLSEIPTPHGRLIDADRLEDRIKNMVGKYDTAIPLNVVYRLIADAHPIIEAEE